MRRPLILLGLFGGAFLFAAPLLGRPPVVRLSAVLIPMLLLAAILARPWRWTEPHWRGVLEWQPSNREVVLAALGVGLLLSWIVLTRFQSGQINAIDFTIYYDRPLYQTCHGRPLYVETSNEPEFGHLTHLAVHAYWLLLPLSMAYCLHATPMWLLALSVVAVVAGGIYILRIGQRLGFGGLVAGATALVFVLNDNTARTLKYGFHPEVLYAWFLPWLIHAGLRGTKRTYLVAAVATVLVKEDACLPLFAAAVALALVRGTTMTRSERIVFLVVPTALALANLAVFYHAVVPALSPGGGVMYAQFWANYGPTPVQALGEMLVHPARILRDMWNSGLLWTVMPPFLFLPLAGWRWSIGTLPIALILGASANDQVHAYGIYYSIVLVPFLVLAAASGTMTLVRYLAPHPAARVLAALLIVSGALLVGRGYSVRPWSADVAAVPQAIGLLAREPVVLVQSGLYPHAGYNERIQLLTPEALRDPANARAAMLLARGVSAYPFRPAQLEELCHLPAIGRMPAALIAVRNEPSRVSPE